MALLVAEAVLAQRYEKSDPYVRAEKCKELANKLNLAVSTADENFYECDKYVDPLTALVRVSEDPLLGEDVD